MYWPEEVELVNILCLQLLMSATATLAVMEESAVTWLEAITVNAHAPSLGSTAREVRGLTVTSSKCMQNVYMQIVNEALARFSLYHICKS